MATAAPATPTNSFLTSQILTRGTNVIIDLLEGDVKKQTADESFENRWIVGTVLRVDPENNTVDITVDEVPSTLEAVYNDETKQNVITVRSSQISLKNPDNVEATDDVTTLAYLHEASLLFNLGLRYDRQIIYTYVGPILIAVNPYQQLPSGMYAKETIEAYRGQPLGKLSPHVFAIAEEAFRNMLNNNICQSILVSGESGAGKTETTKIILKYFAAMSKKSHKDDGKPSIESAVLSSTPVLEAFGNAKTLRNDNSSRFGKFIEIQFDQFGSIVGALLRTYLLEKSRLVRQIQDERNYHIFYQLCAGLSDQERQTLQIGHASDYNYLNQSNCITVDGVDDEEMLQQTKQAMQTVGISSTEQSQIFSVLAAILHIGNIQFQALSSTPDDGCKIIDKEPLQIACQLLGVSLDAMEKTFLTRNIQASRDFYTVKLTADQANNARDSLSMLLYSKVFDWLVSKMNSKIQNSSKQNKFIGILDIYGFETFETNSFEQFCINYANEKLQQQYNQHVFKLSQQEYLKERITWSMLEFNDNQACLDLIEKLPLCILNLLDEQCKLAKSTEKTLAEQLYKNCATHPNFAKPKIGADTNFIVKHYAAQVTYSTTSFLDKNRDYMVPEQVTQLENSSNSFVLQVMKPTNAKVNTQSKAQSNFKFASVSSQFRDSLQQLMDTINSTYPHYIRCIKPNNHKLPNQFNKKQVLHQLKCGGILESVRICLEGYPTKKFYAEFVDRYQFIMVGDKTLKDCPDLKRKAQILLDYMQIENDKYQFGTTKLFLRAGQIEKIEKWRTKTLNDSATKIQKNFKRFMGRRRFLQVKNAATQIQIQTRIWVDRIALGKLRLERDSIIVQKWMRMHTAQKQFLKEQKQIIKIQTCCRRYLADKMSQEKKQYLQSCIVLQSRIRGVLNRRVYKEQLHEAKSMDAIKKQKAGLELQVEELNYALKLQNNSATKLEEEKKKLERDLEHKLQEADKKEEYWRQKYELVEADNKLLKKEVQELKNQLESALKKQDQTELAKETTKLQLASLQTKHSKELENQKEQYTTLQKELQALKAELEKEKQLKQEAQNKLISIEEDKQRVLEKKQSEMIYEIDKAIYSMAIGDRQERAERFLVFLIFETNQEFCNTVPVPSLLIWHIITHWIMSAHHKHAIQGNSAMIHSTSTDSLASSKGDFNSNLENMERLMILVVNSLGALVRTCPPNQQLYWLSTLCSFLQLFALESFGELTKQSIQKMITQYLQKEEYVTFDDAMENTSGGSEMVSGTNAAFEHFIRQLTSSFVKLYTQILYSECKKLEPILKGLEGQLPSSPQLMNTYNAFGNQRNSLLSNSPANMRQYIIGDVVDCLREFDTALHNNFIPDSLRVIMLNQLTHFVDTTLFNDILVRKELCSYNGGMNIKLSIAAIEQAVSSWTKKDCILVFTRQAATLLMMDKNSLVNKEIQTKVVPNLNSLQIHKMLQTYTRGEFENAISAATIAHFANQDPAVQEIAGVNSASTMLLQTRRVESLQEMQLICNPYLENELPYISFPISLKERLEKMTMERIEKERLQQQQLQQQHQQQQQQQQLQPPTTPDKSKDRKRSFWGRK